MSRIDRTFKYMFAFPKSISAQWANNLIDIVDYRNVKLWNAPTRSYDSKCGLWNENAMSCADCGMRICNDVDVLRVSLSNRGLFPPSPWKRTLPMQQILLRVCHSSWHEVPGLIKVNMMLTMKQEIRRKWELIWWRHQLVSRQRIPLVFPTL